MDDNDRLTEIRQEIARLVTEAASIREESSIYVLGWIVAYEGTSVELESEEMSLRGVVTPDHQMVSASLGLGHYARSAFELSFSLDLGDDDD